ncbi:hypothetical protein EHI8A_107290 [Entamoeba histolytica HM-1:IMSS-B]|uniref:Plus3 domain-containing protein n=6 Tax=Entamoeba histolytica TaxID=5759 RepID=C4LZU6_ENTH1|nr:hypothetical protein EHI_194320 [Entamoeba histolytica HM-1:IMSS]EMD47882.1 Hypothetical protein EHI5A_130980 [Entamoeba histolytica KU27]EMH77805.1 hypothetical protein EHI8A_107290 [Entamoeba histolytica HM-1:IMSS-B]EMS12931.1 hypothetical protein KM1_161880 [Entamoeba histolytica HM-3:IMSS]ENY61665.1 hypothetical protein EHI7A_091490 [Entamoeba histolytica HM-1:IMSS-A]GAT94405.1 hypothetical protein CL6EHI_194320 [Entamoeba histolytica]|eukprot:XP_654706.1 hypothetical protein EHI_194320 [Entamoeba histolytica HM-1:IMSS]
MSDIPRRVTRSKTKKMEEDGTEEEDDDFLDDQEEYHSDEDLLDEEDISVEEDGTEEDEKEERKKKRPRSTRTPKSRGRKDKGKPLTFKQMKELYITRENALSYADTAIFERYIVNKYVKVVNGQEEYISLVKSVDISSNIKQVDRRKVAWDLTIETTAFDGSRIVGIGELSNSTLGIENYKRYIEDGKETDIGVMTTKQAREEIKKIETIDNYIPSEEETDKYNEYRKKVYGLKDEEETVQFGKENKVGLEEEREVQNENDKKMEEEVPCDFMINQEIYKSLEECNKRCTEMENYLIFKKEEQNQVKELCEKFFFNYQIPKQTTIYQQTVVIAKETDGKDKLSEEPLAKYL